MSTTSNRNFKKKTPNAKLPFLKQTLAFIKSHKLPIAIILPVLACGGYVGWLKYQDYRQQFTRAEYEQLASIGRSILSVTGEPVDEKRYCYYFATGVYEHPRLHCRVEMVSYAHYIDEGRSVQLAKAFDERISSRFKDKLTDLSQFYAQPKNGIGTVVVALKSPFPNDQCNFTVHSNRAAKRIYTFPFKDSEDFVALSMACSGISRAQFYPLSQ